MNRAKDLRLVEPSTLKPNPANRNIHPQDQIERLVKLIEYQGFRAPVVVSNRSGLVVAGHGRLLAAKQMGLKEIPVSFQDFDDEAQEIAYGVSDNAIGAWAELDMSNIFADMKAMSDGFDFDLFGIQNLDISKLEPDPVGDPDDAPEVPEEPRSVRGDLYELGRHRVLCGDSLSIDDVEKLMGGAVADMVWTDPPYNVAYEGKTADALTIENDSMGDEAFYQFLYDMYSALITVTKPGGAIYVAHADSEGANFREAMKDAGWLLKQCLVWVKQTFAMGRQDYHWRHEPILYGWKPGAAHNWYTDRKQSTVMEFNKPARNAEHPTMKPVELVEYMLGNSSAPNDLVLDVFGGSGTTLIASEKSGRRSCLMELDPRYVDVIVTRYCEYTGNNKIKLNGEEIEWARR